MNSRVEKVITEEIFKIGAIYMCVYMQYGSLDNNMKTYSYIRGKLTRYIIVIVVVAMTKFFKLSLSLNFQPFPNQWSQVGDGI